MDKNKIISKLIDKIDELDLNPIETVEEWEENTKTESHKRGRNNGIQYGLILACRLILEMKEEDL